jgi:hypothetical protein
MKKQIFTKEQIAFLKNLNDILSKKEKEIWDHCIKLFELYEKKRKKFGGDLDDYEIEITAEYITSPAIASERYFYTELLNRVDYYDYYFDYSTNPDIIKPNKPKGERFGFADGNDHREEGQPDFGEKWCYMMHALFDHSSMRHSDIFKIYRIDFDLFIIEQQWIDIVKSDIMV